VVLHDDLTRLVALSPGDGRATALIRRVCAQTLALPALPAEITVSGPGSDAEVVLADFAEQFSIDVSMVGGERRLWREQKDRRNDGGGSRHFHGNPLQRIDRATCVARSGEYLRYILWS